jgi:hypothetical protein
VLRVALMVLACSLVLGPLWGLCSWFALILLVGVGAYWLMLAIPDEGQWREDPLFELMVESVLVGSGALGLFWQIF